tara:strand:- start:1043 stop:2002 length:960 start_codon:yes stop_codon:yes gene_type:complete
MPAKPSKLIRGKRHAHTNQIHINGHIIKDSLNFAFQAFRNISSLPQNNKYEEECVKSMLQHVVDSQSQAIVEKITDEVNGKVLLPEKPDMPGDKNLEDILVDDKFLQVVKDGKWDEEFDFTKEPVEDMFPGDIGSELIKSQVFGPVTGKVPTKPSRPTKVVTQAHTINGKKLISMIEQVGTNDVGDANRMIEMFANVLGDEAVRKLKTKLLITTDKKKTKKKVTKRKTKKKIAKEPIKLTSPPRPVKPDWPLSPALKKWSLGKQVAAAEKVVAAKKKVAKKKVAPKKKTPVKKKVSKKVTSRKPAKKKTTVRRPRRKVS